MGQLPNYCTPRAVGVGFNTSRHRNSVSSGRCRRPATDPSASTAALLQGRTHINSTNECRRRPYLKQTARLSSAPRHRKRKPREHKTLKHRAGSQARGSHALSLPSSSLCKKASPSPSSVSMLTTFPSVSSDLLMNPPSIWRWPWVLARRTLSDPARSTRLRVLITLRAPWLDRLRLSMTMRKMVCEREECCREIAREGGREGGDVERGKTTRRNLQ